MFQEMGFLYFETPSFTDNLASNLSIPCQIKYVQFDVTSCQTQNVEIKSDRPQKEFAIFFFKLHRLQ